MVKLCVEDVPDNKMNSKMKNNHGMLLRSVKNRRDKRQGFMPALEGRLGHTLFGSLLTPGLWVQWVPLAPLVEAGGLGY